jgi:hypothetical protein
MRFFFPFANFGDSAMLETREQRIRTILKWLSAAQATEISALQESIDFFQGELDRISGETPNPSGVQSWNANSELVIMNHSMMCVEYGGKSCFLGNTLMFKFLAQLARRRNRYVSYDVLFDEVWCATRDRSSVRSVVKELRAKLLAAGMRRLCEAIDGRVSGHYGLMLSRAK